jgi:hypothetical protein
MKNQYVGDINDYLKYSVVRAFARSVSDALVFVCWMLTADDGGSDGGLRSYLDSPGRFRAYDPLVFDRLGEAVALGPRHVARIEQANLLPTATYFSTLLCDQREARDAYFQDLWDVAGGHTLLFFDPDNGLSVASVPKGRRNSAKYLYWDELGHALNEGHSVVIYQHFPRVAREQYLSDLLVRIEELSTSGHDAFALSNSRVAFLIAAGATEVNRLRTAAQAIERQWGGLLRLFG